MLCGCIINLGFPNGGGSSERIYSSMCIFLLNSGFSSYHLLQLQPMPGNPRSSLQFWVFYQRITSSSLPAGHLIQKKSLPLSFPKFFICMCHLFMIFTPNQQLQPHADPTFLVQFAVIYNFSAQGILIR